MDRCLNCQTMIRVSSGEYLDRGRLVWHASYKCLKCGTQTEEDGSGIPPSEIREEILVHQGRWALTILISGSEKRLEALHILKRGLELSLDGVSLIREAIPGSVISGTKIEMQWLQAMFVNCDFKVEVGLKSKENLAIDLVMLMEKAG